MAKTEQANVQIKQVCLKLISLFSLSSFVLVGLVGCANEFKVDKNLKVTTGDSLGIPLPTPTPAPPPPTGPVFAADCLTNASFDACIFYKNPVAQKKAALAAPLKFGDDLTAIQTYGVKLKGLTNPALLQNTSIRVNASNGMRAAPVSGAWKFNYRDDTGKSYVAQLMAYYWLTFQEEEMTKRTGVFFAKNKGIAVDAYNSGVQNNAYWDGANIVMGAARMGTGNSEMAMSSEVYLHEMGHANLQFAAQSNINNDPNQANNRCLTAQGCIGGINEGQADFHFLMLFPDSTPLGETWTNTITGLATRDVKNNITKTVTQMFAASSNGEIHGMGAAYAAILYAIYTDPTMVKADFEKLFTLSLQKLTGNSRFPEARDIFLADDAAMFGGKYATIIRNAFNSRGVTP